MHIRKALVTEAARRPGRSPHEWMLAEREAVWSAAEQFSREHDLKVVSRDRVAYYEGLAAGHVDYIHKWTMRIVREMYEGQGR